MELAIWTVSLEHQGSAYTANTVHWTSTGQGWLVSMLTSAGVSLTHDMSHSVDNFECLIFQ